MSPLSHLSSFKSRPQGPVRLACRVAAMALFTAGAALAAADAEPRDVPGPVVQVSPTADQPVVKYERHLFRGEDSGPVLTLFADGRLRTYIPKFMKGSGTFEAHLSPAELLETLTRLFEIPAATPAPNEPAARDRRRAVGLGEPLSILTLRLDGFAATQQEPVERLNARWTLRGTEPADATTELQLDRAVAVRARLDELFAHPALRPVETAP